jgi:hypothetical protein
MRPETNVAVRLYRGEFMEQEVRRHGAGFRLLNVPYYHSAKIDTYLERFSDR